VLPKLVNPFARKLPELNFSHTLQVGAGLKAIHEILEPLKLSLWQILL